MAGFSDSNDIQISVTLDTKSAVESVKQLKDSIQQTLNLTKSEFLRIAEVSKQLNQVAIAQINAKKDVELQALKNQDARNERSFQTRLVQIAAINQATQQQTQANLKIALTAYATELKAARTATTEKIALARIESGENKKLSGDLVKINQTNTKKVLDQFKEAEKTKRQEMKQTLAETIQETVRLRKATAGASRSKITPDTGSGKEIGILSSAFGVFNSVLSKNATSLTAAASGLFILKTAASAAVTSVTSLVNSAFRLSEASARLEGLQTGFETLQRSVGRLPTESIERLRTATQGLISDTELYQRANQAVLLQVPTKLFEESAEAAVKLGRAMGIDAAFALESLSIGLGRQSRLYLDNLGIVVSASEAYRNYAAETGKLVSELTDADKRLAFFNETSKKLKDGLATLPAIQKTVGNEFRELSASIKNVNDEFLKGFNQNSRLADTYSDLNDEVKNLSTAFKNFGDVYAGIIAFILNNPLSKVIVGNSVKLINEVSRNLANKFGNSYEAQILRAKQALAEAESNLADFDRDAQSKALLALGYDRELYETRLETARLTLQNIEAEKKRLDALSPIGLRVDTSTIDNFNSDFTQLVEGIQQKIGEDLGVIRIRGVEQSEVDAASKGIAAIGAAIEEKKITAEEAQAAIAKIVNNLGALASAKSADDVQKRIDKLDKNSKDYAQTLAQLTAERDKYLKTLAPEPAAQNRINAVVEKSLKLGKEGVKNTKNNTKALRSQQKEFESFVKSINKSLKIAIPPEIQERLVEIFNDASLSAQDLQQELIDLAPAARAAGVDFEALKKEVRELSELAAKGIKITVDADTSKANNELEQAYQDQLARAQQQSLNIREIIYGKSEDGKLEGGGFFGFDIGLDPEEEAELAGQFQNTLATIYQAGADGFTREDVPAIAESIGSAIGAAIAVNLGLPPEVGGQIGSVIGRVVGEALSQFGKDKASTRERKAIDAYFADLFDGDRLAIVINSEIEGAFRGAESTIRNGIVRISDLTFEGGALFGGGDFGGAGFRDYFNTVSIDIQNAFNGIGLALGRLQGFAVEQSRLIGTALLNNVGGSLENLQVLVQATGESFENLSDAILQSFLDSQITIEETYNALLQIQRVFEVGLPDAIGDYTRAIDNFSRAVGDGVDFSGRAIVNAFRSIGQEATEATGASFNDVVSQWATSIGLAGEQVQFFFLLLSRAGITSFEQLRDAGERTIVSILEGVRQIREGIATSTEDIESIAIIPEIAPPTTPSSRGGGGRTAEDERREALKKLREETQKLLRDSTEYANILQRLADGELKNAQAGREIIQLQQEIQALLRRRNRLEEQYEKLLEKGRRANKKRLAEIAAELDANRKAIEELTKGAEETTNVFKQLDISAITPLVKSANSLGVLSRIIGVDVKKATDILVQGFLRGKLTLEEFNKQLKDTQDNLGKGIPNEVGAVTTAFQNLVDAGVQGGQFSVDAFSDIFAEFREKFQKEGSAVREEQRRELLAALESAKAAAATAVGPEARELANKALDAAKKALDDFYETVPAPNLADLRSQLEEAFGTEQVNKFFQAIDESGLRTFQELENAGVDGIVPILARLQELGFQFNETSDEIKGINEGLNNAAREAEGNKDPIQEALDLIKQFNEGANGLPPAFNSTTESIVGLNDTLGKLRDGFDSIIEKLGLLSGQTYENDVVFNIRTTGDTSSKALVDILFGDGSVVSAPTGNGGTNGGGSSTATDTGKLSRKQTRLKFLERNGKGSSPEARRLRREIRALGG